MTLSIRVRSQPSPVYWQPQRPPPHVGTAGIEAPSRRDDDVTPTIPGLDKRFVRLAPWQPGHSGTRSGVTKISNGFPQSRQSYSKRGIAHLT